MNKVSADDHVLPRPVEPLSDYALSRARSAASEKLIERFKLAPEAAQCLADSVVDPADLRQSMEHPVRMSVPGGTLLGIRAMLWARKVFPDPRNPRLGPARRHQFAIEPGTGGEDSRFAPVPEPTSDGVVPALHVAVMSREHLSWASDLAKKHVLEVNDWTASIRVQGVMTEVWVVATRYHHADGSPDLWASTTAEGSSRITAAHHILNVRSVDAVYDVSDKQMRAIAKQRNDQHMRGTDRVLEEEMRAERVPALLVVGFEAHPGGTAHFSTAVKSLVALRHVDPPKEWGEGPENESLADACLDELERQDLIPPIHRRWLAGSLTRKEAEAANLSSDAATRAAWIVHTFTDDDAATFGALRLAVTSQSTRKRISPKLRKGLATALIVRALDPAATKNVERVRRYLPEAFSESVRGASWKPTFRSPDHLLNAALAEHQAERDPDRSPLGSGCCELATRAAYALVATLSLLADKGTANNDQPDRRTPGLVIDRMARSEHGLRQLHRALVDYAAGDAIRAIDETGSFLVSDSNHQQVRVTDRYLRNAYAAPGKVNAPGSVVTATERLQQALSEFATVISSLERAKLAIEKVDAGDGNPLVESAGIQTVHVDEWRKVLRDLDDSLHLWGTSYRMRMRSTGLDAVVDEEGDEDLGAEDDEDDEDVAHDEVA